MAKLAKAADGFLVVNGRRIAATSFDLSVETTWTEEVGLDERFVVEFSPSVQRVVGEIGLIRTVGDGGPEGAGMGAPLPISHRATYCSIQYEDRTGVTLWSCEGTAVFGRQTWKTAAKNIQIGSITWRAAGVFTEGSGA